MSKVSKTYTATWSVTRYQHLYRHRSGTYYARLTIQGKKTWRSLQTNLLSIAQPRLAKLLEEERERAERAGISKVARGSMSMAEANELRLQEIRNDASLKKSTVQYYELIHQGVYKSWPELAAKDIREVTQEECRDWAGRFARSMSPTVFNNSLAALRKILEVGIEAGLRTTNPASGIKRVRPSKKELSNKLPNQVQFRAWVDEIRRGKSRWAVHCADLVEFLAYSGLRLDEAKWVLWKHCDLGRGELLVLGDPNNQGTKNRESRRVPMIPSLKNLLTRLHEEASQVRKIAPDDHVMTVHTAKDAMDRAAKVTGTVRITHHDLRHLFATTCIEAGVDIPTVSKWLGHKDGGTLAMRVYGHLRNEHSLESAKKVKFGS